MTSVFEGMSGGFSDILFLLNKVNVNNENLTNNIKTLNTKINNVLNGSVKYKNNNYFEPYDIETNEISTNN